MTELTKSQADFKQAIDKLGYTEAEVSAMTQRYDNIIAFPADRCVYFGFSKVHGLGLFANKKFREGELVCEARIGLRRTPGGRYVNHSSYPNIEVIVDGLDVNYHALVDINPREELLLDYVDAFSKSRPARLEPT